VVDASGAAIETADRVAAMTAGDERSIAASATNVDPSLSLQPWTLDQSVPEQGMMMGSGPQQGQVLPEQPGFDQPQEQPQSPGERDMQYRKQQQYEQYMQQQALPAELELPPPEGGAPLTPPATPEMQAPPAAAAHSPLNPHPRALQFQGGPLPTDDVEERDARRR
jgi:hypothetical protein